MENKLSEMQAEYLSKRKRVVLAEAGISLTDLERYERYLSDDASDDELREQSERLIDDIGGNKDGNKGGNNGKVWRL